MIELSFIYQPCVREFLAYHTQHNAIFRYLRRSCGACEHKRGGATTKRRLFQWYQGMLKTHNEHILESDYAQDKR